MEATEAQLKELETSLLKGLNEHWTKRNAEQVEALAKQYEAQLNEKIKALSKAFPTFSVPGTEPTGDHRKDFSFARAAHAIKTKDWTHAGLEAEMFKATKAMSTLTDGGGGFMVPEQAVSEIIKPLRANAVALKLGMRDRPGFPNAPISIPRLSTDVAATWLEEGAAGTKADAVLANLKLRPRKIMTLTDVTNELLASGVPAVDSMIIESASSQITLAVDIAAMTGTGNSAQPKGIVNQTGVGSSTLAGPTYDQLLTMRATVRHANGLKGRCGWALSSVKLLAIEQMVDAANQPLERRVLGDSVLTMLVGYPFEVTTQLPSSGANAAIFGNWESLMFARFGGLEIRVFDGGDTNQTNDTSTVRLIMRGDIGVDQPASFCVASA